MGKVLLIFLVVSLLYMCVIIKGGQPPHRGSIAEKCITPPTEEIFSSNFQHWYQSCTAVPAENLSFIKFGLICTFSQNQLGQTAPVLAHFCYMFYSRQETLDLNQLHTYKHHGQDECLSLILGSICENSWQKEWPDAVQVQQYST